MVNHDGTDTKDIEEKAEESIQNILKELENFLVPIYYIPGNHDPRSLYQEGANKPLLSIRS